MKRLLGVTLTAILLASGSANAQSVLYRNDFNIPNSVDQMGVALSQLGYSTTSTYTDLQSYNLSDFSAVVYANQGSATPSGDAAILSAYIANGGRVIYQDWYFYSARATLNSSIDGTTNQTVVSLSQFSEGVGSTLSLTNPGYGVFSTGLKASVGGTVAATFANGSAAIVLGNDGRTIHNGFLTSTLDGTQLYKNQLQSLFAPAAAVPEPATWAMMMIGFGVIGYSMRRRTKVRFASAI